MRHCHVLKIKVAYLEIAFKEHAFPSTAMSGNVADWPACLTTTSPVVVIIYKMSGHFEWQVSCYSLQHGGPVLRRQLVQYRRVTCIQRQSVLFPFLYVRINKSDNQS